MHLRMVRKGVRREEGRWGGGEGDKEVGREGGVGMETHEEFRSPIHAGINASTQL